MNKQIDQIIILSSLSILFTLYGVLAIPQPIPIPAEEVAVVEAVEEEPSPEPIPTEEWKPSIGKVIQEEYIEYIPIDEESISTALMYATEPIGRYYITAYSHLETGSKITASGGKVHKGTITTCAADVPKYFHFGDYVYVEGYGLYRVEDTGSAVKKKHLDLYEPSMKKLNSYTGYKQVYRVYFPFGKPKDD